MNRRQMLATFAAPLGLMLRGKPLGVLEQGLTNDDCVLRKFVMPTYAPYARQAGVESKVSVGLHIGTDGKVISVDGYSGHDAFKESVSDALKQWQFNPSNEPHRGRRVEFRFSLKGSRDERCLNYRVAGSLPDYFEIEVNPFPDAHSGLVG